MIPTPAIAALCELHPSKRLEWDDKKLNLLSGHVDKTSHHVSRPVRGLRALWTARSVEVRVLSDRPA